MRFDLARPTAANRLRLLPAVALALAIGPGASHRAHGAAIPRIVRNLKQRLFVNGAEAFRVVDERGETPRFRLLDSTSRRRALALAINSALRRRPDADKGVPSFNYLEARVERLILRPDDRDGSRLRAQVRVSGQTFEIRDLIDRKAFEEGRKIGLRIRPHSEEAPPVRVASSGHLAIRWNAPQNAIEIARAEANLTVSAPLSDDLTESIEFRGLALRD
jgi:hypothetical protein